MTTTIERVMNTPPIVVVGATIFGYTLPEVAAGVTIVYTLLLLYLRLRREWRLWRAGRKEKSDGHV
ncbi:MAG: hypothetical protein V4505_00570 [Pseudomonadota bacterium]